MLSISMRPVLIGRDWEVLGMNSKAADRAAAGEHVQTQNFLSEQTVAAATAGSNGTVIAEGPPTLVGAGIVLVALIVAVSFLFHKASGPTYTPAAGIGAFALFYIVAQAAESMEWAMDPTAMRQVRHQRAALRAAVDQDS